MAFQGSLPSIDEVFDAAYWCRICPHLQISSKGIGCNGSASHGEVNAVTQEMEMEETKAKNAMITNGFFRHTVSPETKNTVSQLAQGVALLDQHGWPATFIMAFDACWKLAHEMSEKMKHATGNKNNGDILAWYIDPSKGHSGFSPHRDRVPENPQATFRHDGSPLYASAWVALSDAHERNSCLHMIPKHMDPGYGFKESKMETSGLDAADTAREDREAEEIESLAWDYFTGTDTTSQKVREIVHPLPCNPGDAVFFSHTILHWGSRGQTVCEDPRISMSVACSDDQADPAYFDRELHLPCPSMELRVALAAGQMISYFERFQLSSAQLLFFREVFQSQRELFHISFQGRVDMQFKRWQDQQEKERQKKTKSASKKGYIDLNSRIREMKKEQRQSCQKQADKRQWKLNCIYKRRRGWTNKA